MKSDAIWKSVHLTPEEAALLEASRDEGSPAHEALTQLLGPAAARSEAAALRGVLNLGLDVIRERIALNGYSALAVAQDDEDHSFCRALRERRSGEKG